MPVFVTGATGYIGESAVRELRRRAHVVRALVRSEASEKKLGGAPGIEALRGDLRDLDVLRAACADADAVVHCAQEQSAEGVAIERAALEAMLDAMRPGAAFVYTSGCWVYGSRGDAVVAEDAPLAPLDIVAWRPAHEQLVLAQDGRLRAVVIRPGIVYGDERGIPGSMVQQARSGALTIVGDGSNRWPCVRHDALAELYGRVVDERVARGIYNATRGASIPYGEIAHAASRAAGRDGRVSMITLEEGRARMGGFADALACDLQCDSSRAARELGWEPHRPTLLEELANSVVV